MTFPRSSARRAGRPAAVRTALVCTLLLAAAGCRQDMHDAPRYEAYEASDFYADGRSSREAPANTVARGWLRADQALYTGKDDTGQFVEAIPFALSHADLERGRDRFTIYCTPCHGQLGDGNGMVVQRGLRQAASYHQDRLRQERIGYFFDVITNGFGAMQGYAEQVPVRDRWLIAAYVRALQYSQYAPLADVPADHRADLDRPEAAAQTPSEPGLPASSAGQPQQPPSH